MQIESANLPSLISLMRLFNDSSRRVRELVKAQLESHWIKYEQELLQSEDAEFMMWQQNLGELFRNCAQKELRAYLLRESNPDSLELKLSKISWFIDRSISKQPINDLLDGFAHDFLKSGLSPTASDLAKYLFGSEKLRGNVHDFYNPCNSDLHFVLTQGLGVPISLCTVYELIGKRMGLEIYGCNNPVHFISRASTYHGEILVDCFNKGKIWEKQDWQQFRNKAPVSFDKAIKQPASDKAVIIRYLRNLSTAYRFSGEKEQASFFLELYSQMEFGNIIESKP